MVSRLLITSVEWNVIDGVKVLETNVVVVVVIVKVLGLGA
jgi:hypothetical protein